MRLVAAAVVVVVLTAGCGQQCRAKCVHEYTVSLVDAQGAGVAPGRGQVTLSSATSTFDCAPGTWGGEDVDCLENAVRITSDTELSALTLDVTEQGGTRNFNGVLQLNVTAHNVCGVGCTTATTTATMR
jgi:hypothetical protein